MSRVIYLDHHATTPLDPRVFEAMRPWYCDHVGNAASHSHQAGRTAAAAVAAARESLAHDLGCEPTEIIFTSGATEANNLAIKGVLAAAGRDAHVVSNTAEHRAVLDPIRRWKRCGGWATVLPVDRFGCVEPETIREAIYPRTRIVSVMLANNEVGSLNDLPTIVNIAREQGVWLHTDASQAVGRIPLDLTNLPVDLLSLTAHKLYGPQGVGALIIRQRDERIPIEPLFDGGGHERGIRSGTLPTALIVGFAAAVRLAVSSHAEDASRLSLLRDRLWLGLKARIDRIERNGHPTRRLPGNLNVTIADVDGDALMIRLRSTELAVSSGAACSSANPEPSHVLRAMRRSDAEARSSLRFGLGRGNTLNEIDAAIEIVSSLVTDLRSITD